MKYADIFRDSFSNYWHYLSNEIIDPHWGNFIYWLAGISLIVWFLELLFPWRKNQKAIRKDFWLDAFYMLFNMIIFSLIGFYAISNVVVTLFYDLLAKIGIRNSIAIEINTLPFWLKIIFAFILKDLIQWLIHRLLHRNQFLWQFHKVHHSVKEMGFAAQLRYHWMENIIYNVIQYLPLAILGFGINEYLAAGLIALTIGHFNHSNILIRLGPFKYIFNNPQMHIWHHAKHLPEDLQYGVNFGLSLSIWDYLFKTNYIPYSGRDIELGFRDDDKFPSDFIGQEIYPLRIKGKINS